MRYFHSNKFHHIMDEILIPEQHFEKEGDSAKKKDKKDKKDKEAKELLTLERTELALYRTQLAMVRTATTFTTFGFAIYKLMEEKKRQPGEHPIMDFLTPKTIAIILFFTGFFGLLMSSINYFRILKRINRFSTDKYWSTVMILSYVLLLLTGLLIVGTLIKG